METMNLLDDGQSTTGTLGITGDMMNNLDKTASWLRYLGIVGMVVCGLFTIILFIGLFAMSGINEQGIYPDGALYIGLLVIIIMFVGAGFISLLLYRYGSNLKKYILKKEVAYLEEAIENNKNLWLILGAVSIISIILFMLIGFAASTPSTI